MAMQKVIGDIELERTVQAVLDDFVQQRVPYILARDNHPEAVIIPYDDFLRFQEYQQAVYSRFDDLVRRMIDQNDKYSDDEISMDIEASCDG